MGRIIGVINRVNKTKKREARPAMVAVQDGTNSLVEYELFNEQGELDFIQGFFPCDYQEVKSEEELSRFFMPRHIKTEGKKKLIPKRWDGLSENDILLVLLGGSGDRFTVAAYRTLKKLGGQTFRIPAFHLQKEEMEKSRKLADYKLLIELFKKKPHLFYEMSDGDTDLISLRHALSARMEIMKARIAYESRLQQSIISEIFLAEPGGRLEGTIESRYDKMKDGDIILRSLILEEKMKEDELKAIMDNLPVWQKLFEPIEGVGPMIAARLIVAIGDVRRFRTVHQLKKFCGVHVTNEGQFVRRRSGQTANWHPEAREALFLLGEQFNMRPTSEWGQKLRDYKKKFREKYTQPKEIPSKTDKSKIVTKYSDGHIHRMATWRTLTKFVEWLYREWSRLMI